MRLHLEFVLGICRRGDNVPAGGLQIERAAGVTETPAKALSARALLDTVLGPCLGNGAGEIAAAGIRAQDHRAKVFLTGSKILFFRSDRLRGRRPVRRVRLGSK